MPADNATPSTARQPFPAELADLRDDLHARFTSTPMYETLGIVLEDWGPGWATASMEASPRLGNLAGTLHGGAAFTLADAVFEVACNSYGRLAVALETTCHYHQPAPLASTLVAHATEVSRGNRTATYALRVCDGDDKLLISYLALAYRTSRWHVDQARVPPEWR